MNPANQLEEKVTHAIEAIASPSALLSLPNFHILVSRNDDGVMQGICLDFGIVAYSQQKDDRIAIDKIFTRLSEMALHHILSHLRRNTESNLYENGEALEGQWGLFVKEHRKGKISKLRKSYDKLMRGLQEDPDAFLDKINNKRLSMDVVDFANLNPKAQEALKGLLEELSNVKHDEVEEVIAQMMSVLPGAYKIRLAA